MTYKEELKSELKKLKTWKRRKTSSSDGKNPYQCPEKLNPFWRGNPLYSEASKVYFEERAQVFTMSEANSKKISWHRR